MNKIQKSDGLFLWINKFYFLTTLAIITRLFYLQIYLGPIYTAQSRKNYIRHQHIAAPRGQILDCNRKPLVTNIPIRSLYWQSTGKSRLTDEQKRIISQLSYVCQISYDEQLIQTIAQAEKRNHPLLLYHNITFHQLATIEEMFSDHPNIVIKTEFKRSYPYKKAASHIIGYLGNIHAESTGKMGLEKAAEMKLQGHDGAIIKTINSYGKEIHTDIIEHAIAGTDIETTIDIDLQKIAEKNFSDEYIGTCIIMDPETGALKTLLSRPNFDPNIFLEPIYYQQWKELQEHQPFLNRAVHCSYPPGSLFKLITISAALETELISPDDMHNCKGYIHYGDRDYWCNRHNGHDIISVRQGLALSCNTLFYELGKKLSINTLADYAQRFGLGQKTGFLLSEAIGLIPTTSWKRETKGEPWWQGETLSASIGQSYLLTTPLQIARMFSGIFVGYLPKPRILKDEPIEKNPLYIKPETLEFLKKSMKSVVTEGTGRRVNRIKDIEVYAKTSTAQISTIDKRGLGQQYFEHGWVVVHFTIKGQKPLILVVLVEHAGTSRIPVIIAKNLLLDYKKYYERRTP
jgi:penicillin-binding protein 2